MKHVVFFIYCFFTICAFAQSPDMLVAYTRDAESKKVIGQYDYAVTYKFIYTIDTVNCEKRTDMQVLKMGKAFSHYYSLFAEKTDSISLEGRYSEENRPQAHHWLKKDEKAVYTDYYQNYPTAGTLTVRSFIIKFDYEYSEPLVDFDWIMVPDSTLTILGYPCYLATTSFRGRQYKAYFTTEIPTQYGPWKFRNLPGLILRVSDTDNLFEWEAVGFTNEGGDIYINDPVEGRKKAKSSRDYTQAVKIVTREQLAKLEEKKWKDNPGLRALHGLKAPFVQSPSGQWKRLSIDEEHDMFKYPYIPPLELE